MSTNDEKFVKICLVAEIYNGMLNFVISSKNG